MSTAVHAIEGAMQRYAEDETFRDFVMLVEAAMGIQNMTIDDAQEAFTLIAERRHHARGKQAVPLQGPGRTDRT